MNTFTTNNFKSKRLSFNHAICIHTLHCSVELEKNYLCLNKVTLCMRLSANYKSKFHFQSIPLYIFNVNGLNVIRHVCHAKK